MKTRIVIEIEHDDTIADQFAIGEALEQNVARLVMGASGDEVLVASVTFEEAEG